MQLFPTTFGIKPKCKGLAEKIDLPLKTKEGFEPEAESANLISALWGRMGAQQSFNAFGTQGRTRISNIQVGTLQQYFHPVRNRGALGTGLMCFENGVCPILDQFQNLSVAVAAGEDCFLNAEMFPDVSRGRLVGL